MAARNYRDLVAWQKAMDLAEGVYELTRHFPDDERFSLTTQLRRSCVSVASNIAKGDGRFSKSDFHRFRSYAHGSVREAETQILLALRLKYISHQESEDTLALSSEVGRLIQGLANALQTK